MTIIDQARNQIVQNVPEPIRQAAFDAIKFFADRPSAPGIDFDLQALKLAGMLHAIGAEPDDVLDAMLRLERTVKFRPTNDEIVAAVESSMAKTLVTIGEIEGRTFVCSEIKARTWERMSEPDRAQFIQQQRELKGIHDLPALPTREISQETVNRLAELGIRPEGA